MAGAIHIDQIYLADIKELVADAAEKAAKQVMGQLGHRQGVSFDELVEEAMQAAYSAVEDDEFLGELAERVAHIVTDNVKVDIDKEG